MKSEGRPLLSFLVALAVAGCGGGGSGGGGSGGAGGSSTQTGGSGGKGGATTSGGAGGGATAGSGGAGQGGGGAGGSAAGGSGQGGAQSGGSGPGDAGQGGAGGSPPDGSPSTGALKVEMPFVIPGATNGAPHDPAVDSKGVSWWTDQGGSRIGFWDPATGMTDSFGTPTPNCGVHGLISDDKDDIWYTGQRCNRIGKLDRTTKVITEYPVPNGGGPHTPVIVDGIIWFTLQGGDKIGRLDPKAPQGDVRTFDVGRGPYGIWVAPNKRLWVALHGADEIVEVDPSNPAAPNRIKLPSGSSRPRRIAVDRKGHVYYTDDGRAMGYLGRYDPTNPALPMAERFKEWPTPGGAQPYGITVGPEGDERIFYGFTGRNVIAVFDPAKPESQIVVQIPVQIAANRHMTTDNVRRRIWLGLSGAQRMAYIQLP